MGASCSSRNGDAEGSSNCSSSLPIDGEQRNDGRKHHVQLETDGDGGATQPHHHPLSVVVDDAVNSSQLSPRLRSNNMVVVNDDGRGNRSGGGAATFRGYRATTSRHSQGTTPSASANSALVGYPRINPFAAHELIHLSSNNGSLPPLSVSPSTTRTSVVAAAPSSSVTSWTPMTSGSPLRRDNIPVSTTSEDKGGEAWRRMASSSVSPASPSQFRRQTSQTSRRSQVSASTPRGFKSVLLPAEAPVVSNLLFDGRFTPEGERTDSTVARRHFSSSQVRSVASGTFTAHTMSADFGSVVDEEDVRSQDSEALSLHA